MTTPSKNWKESISSLENEIFEKYKKPFSDLQLRKSEIHGVGRGLHRKQILGLSARLEILADIPDCAKCGLFSSPGKKDVFVRLSNGSLDTKPDREPDIRGFAIKVLDVKGAGSLGTPTESQDFLLINHAAFSFPDFESFIQVVLAAGEGIPSLIGHLIKKHGFIEGFKRLIASAKNIGKPFTGFATEAFHSAAPIAMGEYAAKVKINPKQKVKVSNTGDFAKDFSQYLVESDLEFDFQLQFYTEDNSTPIEDPTKEWTNSPFVTVAKLVIRKQEIDFVNESELSKKIKLAHFDPWNSLEVHRPLGQIMRARKHYYYISQQNRK